jgi:pilus assembly protein CpaB
MRSRGMLMLLLAVFAGLAAVVLAARWMQGQGGDRSRVAVAAVEIPLGAVITPEVVKLVEWPQNSLPPGAFNELDKLQGRVVTGTLQRGEPVLEARLAPVGTKGGLSAIVPEGKRAMTVRVNDVVGVAGFALPGTFVDVLVNTQADGSKNSDRDRTISKIVLARMLVLAVAQEVDRDSTKPRVVNAVTLEVTPQQAETLDLARSVGTLSLVLRNQSESGIVSTDGVTKEQLLNGGRLQEPAPAPVVAAARPVPRPRPRPVADAPVPAPAPVLISATPVDKPRHCIEIIRGLTKVTECF